MKKSQLLGAMCTYMIMLLASPVANASLVPVLGGQAVYDTDLDITWLADANYAQTSGFNSDGWMTWSEAVSWADGLVFGGFDDWRLPATIFPDAGCSIDGTGNGSFGGLGCTRSEMGHLFYDELLGTAGLSILTSGDAMELAKFTNIQDLYWSSTEFEINSPAAWLFLFSFGFQDADFKSGRLAAWAVRDGDVRAVPVPTAVLLFGSGLLGLVGIARRKKA